MLRKFSDFLSGKASIFIILTALKQVLSESDEIDLHKVFPKTMIPVVELLKEKYAVTGYRSQA